MKRNQVILALLVLAAAWAPSPASARHLSVELRTDRGHDAVYQPGEDLEVKVRPSDDAYLLVYEIDAEGYIHVLFPTYASSGWVEGRQTLRLPDDVSDLALVVQGPVGQGYIVAVAAREPFAELPWYLRSRDSQAEEVGYFGGPEDEDRGVTAEGRIVGDPFVAMERIRRQVVLDHDDLDAFATAYTSYYVHERVLYPRYLCNDCHRSGHWSWWAGFDPYYARCSVIDYRVNWHWSWGPSSWFGSAPYFVYVYRPNCPPRFRRGFHKGTYYSSWDGWPRWRALWGQPLIRHKTGPPVGYVPPGKFKRGGSDRPPGYSARGKGSIRVRRAGVPRQDRGNLVRGAREPVRGRSLASDRPRAPKRAVKKAPIGRSSTRVLKPVEPRKIVAPVKRGKASVRKNAGTKPRKSSVRPTKVEQPRRTRSVEKKDRGKSRPARSSKRSKG